MSWVGVVCLIWINLMIPADAQYNPDVENPYEYVGGNARAAIEKNIKDCREQGEDAGVGPGDNMTRRAFYEYCLQHVAFVRYEQTVVNNAWSHGHQFVVRGLTRTTKGFAVIRYHIQGRIWNFHAQYFPDRSAAEAAYKKIKI